jgi:two-component system response regulator FixJ
MAATVFVVDDEAEVRTYLRCLIESVGLTVESFASGAEFLQSIGKDRPGCIVLDVRMAGMGGLQLLSEVAAWEVPLPVIILTGHADVPLTTRAMRAGAIHVLQKPPNEQELLDTISEALRRDEGRRAGQAQRKAARSRLDTLTAREREILDLILGGNANKVIARRLDVTVKNIEFHRANIMKKMQASNQVDLVRMVLELSLAK